MGIFELFELKMGNCSDNCTKYCKGKDGENEEFQMQEQNPTKTQVQVQRLDNVNAHANENAGDTYGGVNSKTKLSLVTRL